MMGDPPVKDGPQVEMTEREIAQSVHHSLARLQLGEDLLERARATYWPDLLRAYELEWKRQMIDVTRGPDLTWRGKGNINWRETAAGPETWTLRGIRISDGKNLEASGSTREEAEARFRDQLYDDQYIAIKLSRGEARDLVELLERVAYPLSEKPMIVMDIANRIAEQLGEHRPNPQLPPRPL